MHSWYKGAKVVNIDWDEYKEFKLYSIRNDNFEVLLDFLKSYYNLTNPYDIFDSLKADGIGEMMLQKRDIGDAEALEQFLRRL